MGDFTKNTRTEVDDNKPFLTTIVDSDGRVILAPRWVCSSSKMETRHDYLNGVGFDLYDENPNFRRDVAQRLNRELVANIELWAAAPDMYEALKVLVEDVRHFMTYEATLGPSTQSFADAEMRVFGNIAKAKAALNKVNPNGDRDG